MTGSASWGLFLIFAGYLLTRSALGGLVNPPFNGPDEGGHWEYVETFTASGGRAVSGVERQQPATYYALASLPFRATEGAPIAERLFVVRLLSAAAGLVTAGATWWAARRLWPGRPLLGVIAVVAVSLAPGHLFLLASVNNDPLAEALASIAVLVALHLRRPAAPIWWALWLVVSAGAVATKLSTAPVVTGAAIAVLWGYRRPLRERLSGRVGRPLAVAAGAAAVVAVLALYLRLLAQPPSTSRLASIAHFWPLTLWRAVPAYVQGGLVESFRTFWYAYDYAVRWPQRLDGAFAAAGLVLVLGAAAGLGLIAAGAGGRRRLPATPPVLWLAAGTQVGLVVVRFGFSQVLQVDMGGLAQAKSFFPAMLPLALLFTAGWAALASALGRGSGRPDDRWLTLGLLGAFLLLDWASLAVTLWHHYRWWQPGL
jgi:hypothetical protein